MNPPPFFESLDLLDLWHVYGRAKDVADIRTVSVSKVSRNCWHLVSDFGVNSDVSRGAPDLPLAEQASLLLFRRAYQQWRLENGSLKVLPAFAGSAAFKGLERQLDVLPDVYLSSEALASHLQARRIDLVLSSSLDLAGELIRDAQVNPRSPFAVVPLFQDEICLAVNPAHPLAGMNVVTPEDCMHFPSAGYPEGIACLAADALRARGAWRFACKRDRFDAAEWSLGLRSQAGLCYETLFLSELMPAVRELVVMPFAEPLHQTNCLVMLKELMAVPEMEAAVAMIRRRVDAVLAHSNHAFNRC